MTADSELLRAYADRQEQAAFAELVRRHIDFVYAVALRRLGGRSGLAQDVSQEVFLVLARKADALVDHPALKAWLFRTARLCAGRAETADRRRRTREQEAYKMNDTHAAQPADEAWAKLRPNLDAAMEQLSESDRQVVILRFFAGDSYADIGRALSIGEDGARQRLNRALGRLAAALQRRGISSTAAGLAMGLGAETAMAAPAGLAVSITSAVQSQMAALGAAKATTLFLSMTTSKIMVGISVTAALLSIAVSYRESSAKRQTASLLEAEREQASALRARLTVAESRVTSLERSQADEISNPTSRATASRPPAASQRAIVPKSGPTAPTSAAFDPKNYRRNSSVLGFGSDIEVPTVRTASVRSKVALDLSQLGPFFAARGIPPEIQRKLGETMSNDWHALMDLAVAARSEGYSDDHPNEAMYAVARERQAQLQQRIQELLGPSDYAAYREYQDTLPQQDVMARLAGSLYYTPDPLTTAQANELLGILNAHKRGHLVGAGYVNYGWSTAVIADDVVTRAANVLKPGQLEALKRLQAMQEVPIARGEVRK